MTNRGKKSARNKNSNDRSLFDQPGNNGDTMASDGPDSDRIALHETAQRRYLNYALSVITSRALPDVRDGLKPVQRRILYTMWRDRLTAETKHRKCAGVVGATMQHYHPHGDQAIYEALVRMAQPFMMRTPLVEGSGNFGSLDGDPPAAMRYTECRIAAIAATMLDEIGRDTVHFRPNYDGTKSEPVVLPSRLPNLLINGATGIAVGMATNIPPHNFAEVCKALLKLLDNPEIKDYQLVGTEAIQGPDFPTGGHLLNSQSELRELYKTGSGALKIRATTRPGPATRLSKSLQITSIPYGVNKAILIEQIAQVIESRKMPLLLDVRDLSAEDVRIDLELKKSADEQKVLAYLHRHTLLQTHFNVNFTCLVPTENPEVSGPEKLGLHAILRYFLNFRLEVVTRRLAHELDSLKRRIHLLEGFSLVFDALDEIIKIVRRSDSKSDAAKKIMAKFKKLDHEQTDAILELKLYRLAKLEINLVLDEQRDKERRASKIGKLLDDNEATGRWDIVRREIEQLIQDHAGHDPRRTIIDSVQDEPEFSAEDFIVAEDNHVLVTTDGWVKRQKEIRDPMNTRLREGDSVLVCEVGSTRATILFLSNYGAAYTCRIIDIPATTGHGEPIQKLFKLKDGEQIVAAFSLDPRAIGDIQEEPGSEYAPETHAVAVSSDGFALRFGLEPFVEPSTRNGRRYARPKSGAEITGVAKIHGDETLLTASVQCRAMVCPVDEINYLSGPGKGVMLIKLAPDDHLLGFKASDTDRDLLRVRTHRGAEKTISTAKYRTTGRGGKGVEIQKNGRLSAIIRNDVCSPQLTEPPST